MWFRRLTRGSVGLGSWFNASWFFGKSGGQGARYAVRAAVHQNDAGRVDGEDFKTVISKQVLYYRIFRAIIGGDERRFTQ